MSFDWSFVLTTLPAFGQSVHLGHLQLGAIVILTSLAVALLNVALQSLHKPWLNRVIRAMWSWLRNTPLLIQLFFLYLVAALGISLSGFATAVIAMTFLGGGYLTEALRAAFRRSPASWKRGGPSASCWQLLRHAAAPRPGRQPPALFANSHLSAQRDHGGSAVAVPSCSTPPRTIALYYKTHEMLAVLTLMCVLIFCRLPRPARR